MHRLSQLQRTPYPPVRCVTSLGSTSTCWRPKVRDFFLFGVIYVFFYKHFFERICIFFPSHLLVFTVLAVPNYYTHLGKQQRRVLQLFGGGWRGSWFLVFGNESALVH